MPPVDPAQEAAREVAEASIREAEALMASVSVEPIRRRPAATPAPPRRPSRAARPAVAAQVARLSARARAIGWTRRQAGGVGLTLAFIPLGWVVGAAVLSDDAPVRDAIGIRSSGVSTPASFDPKALTSRRASGALVAHARGRSLRLYRRPGGRRRGTLQPRSLEGRRLPIVALVERRRSRWLRIHLPVRPNGSTAWVRARDVRLRANPYRVQVQLSRHRITVWRGKRVVARRPIGVGKSLSPTPTGRYFVTDLVRARNAADIYGPYAFGLSAFSPVYTSFRGGDGQIGIHGTNEPQLLGKDVSAGCIRVSNRFITRLSRMLPLGTPVTIRR